MLDPMVFLSHGHIRCSGTYGVLIRPLATSRGSRAKLFPYVPHIPIALMNMVIIHWGKLILGIQRGYPTAVLRQNPWRGGILCSGDQGEWQL